MPIANNVGQVVRGDDFFERLHEERLLWEALESGSNVLLAAPRRVGKSSLVEFMRDNPRDTFHLVYLPVESIEDEEEFFRKLYAELFLENASYGAMMLEKTKKLLSLVRKVGISAAGSVELDAAQNNWYEKFLTYIANLVTTDEFANSRLVLVLDEFPQTVENIRKKHGSDAAIRFLQVNRDIRHIPVLHKTVQFIYTGSIGLEHAVGKLNASRTINDLNKVSVGAMADDEARHMVREIVTHSNYRIPAERFTPDIITYILNKIQWCTPYYIQLLLRDMARRQDLFSDAITTHSIDQTFEGMMKDRHLFEHLFDRLEKVLSPEEMNFAEAVLNELSMSGATLTRSKCRSIGAAHNVSRGVKDILNLLEYDGYIAEKEGRYSFVSPVVQMWWRENVAS